ncbi:MAG: M56 family metallopeptidase [Bacteroidota bacterium]|nr:M56 family metallopeptidase [Bacteroidota bacterium]
MNAFILYLLQASLCLVIFYGIYWLFLRRDTFFTVNRFYLIGSIVFSLSIPLFDFSSLFLDVRYTYYVILDTITITPGDVTKTLNNNLNLFQILFVIYFTGVCIFTLRFLFQFAQLMVLLARNKIIRKHGLRMVLVDKYYSPFSFFNIIFINISKFDEEGMNEIIEHERIHIRQLHSLDVLILEVLTILFWFNPFVWFYRKSIKSIHEFLADEGVLSHGTNKKHYQELLLQQSLGTLVNDMTNNFNQSLIKRRFIMMTKSKSNGTARLKLLFVLPLAVMLVVLTSLSTNIFAQEEVEIPLPPPKSGEILLNKDVPPPPSKATQDEDKVHKEVEQMPEYPGGLEALYAFLVENIKYPDIAKQQGIAATIFVRYIVEKDGSITDVNILGIKTEVDEEKYKEALNVMKKESMRVVHAMPNWKPGKDKGNVVRVEYALPIAYRLDEKTKKKAE